ncbi:MAG: hypothetical protein STHCBS139747_005087 [Sporothrix thermara]
MTSYHHPERRGRSSRRQADRYDNGYGHDNYYSDSEYYDNGRYGYGRGDYTAIDGDYDDGHHRHRHYPPSASRSRRSKSSHNSRAVRPNHRRSHSSYDQPSQSHSHSHSASSSASSRRSSSTSRELRHVVTSAITAGALEAFRLRKTPGNWTSGHKAGRVATAAIGAAVTDTAVESNNRNGKHTRRHVVESAVAGLLTDRLVNGSRKKK